MRPPNGLLRVMLCGLLVPLALAQTIIVDAANGPGTNFTTIQAAVDAAPVGATLLVRAGAYDGFLVDGKGLALLCDPGVTLASATLFPAVRVQQVPVHERFVLRGGSAGPGTQWSMFTGCAGSVHVEETVGIGHTGSNCAQVMLKNCAGSNASFTSCDVVLEGCSFRGADAVTLFGSTTPARPAVSLAMGRAQFVDCALIGGDGTWWIHDYADAPGLLTNGSAVRVLGATTIASGAGLVTGSPAIDGTGTLRLDPAVVLTASAPPPIAPAIATTLAVMPAVRSRSAAPGGTLVGDALGPVGSTVVLVFGLPALPIVLPGIGDAFWIGPSAYSFVAIGRPQPAQPVSANVVLPNVAAFRGLALAWQSVALIGVGLEASNPSFSLVH